MRESQVPSEGRECMIPLFQDTCEQKGAKRGMRSRLVIKHVSPPDRLSAAADARGTQAPQAVHLLWLPNRGQRC